MGIIGTPRKFHTKFKFLVEVDGIGYAGYRSCSNLKSEAGDIDHHEGGVIIPDKQPGKLKISDVTLEHGATSDLSLWIWHNECWNAARNGGLVDDRFKRMATIRQLDRDNSTIMRWRLYRAYCKLFDAGAWDNEADENVVRQVVLRFDYFVPLIGG
jgi:phage tail-like protein